MKFKKFTRVAALALASVFIVGSFAACGRGGDADATTPPAGTPAQGQPPAATPAPPAGTPAPVDDEEILRDPFGVLRGILEDVGLRTYFDNPNPIIPGGTLRQAIGSTGSIPGQFCGVHWINSLDNEIRAFTHESLLMMAWNMEPSNLNTPARADFDPDARTITITMLETFYWHDGVPVTLDDLVFAHYVVTNIAYTGPRWGASFNNVVGAVAYRNGEADHIEGLVLSDCGNILTIHMINFAPPIRAFGFWTTPIPRHQWEASGVPISEMQEHPLARHETLGNGPFILDAIVPGESVRVRYNPYHWRGRPYLDFVTIELLDPMMMPMALQAGMYDIGSMPQSLFTEEFRYLSNVVFLSNPFTTNSSTWFTFRMGTFDADQTLVVAHETPYLSNTVRRAIALSIDWLSAGQLFNGLVVPTGSVYFGLRRYEWINQQIPTWNHFDPEEAMRMLDEAGYIDRTGDGWRDRPDGSPLVIIYGAITGSAAAELNRALELQNWRDIGLNVDFYQGRLVEPAVMTDVRNAEADGGVVTMFTTGWGLGANPNPRGIFGNHTRNNHPRYTSELWCYIMDRFEDDQMWNEDFLLETVDMWQWAVSDTDVLFPTNVAVVLTTINRRVANFTLEVTGDASAPNTWANFFWGLTALEPYVCTN